MAAARTMPEPINAVTLAIAVGVDRPNATNWINQHGIAKGWLVKVGRGNYNRTKDYPKAN
jgi:hypothetical protein